MKRTLVLAFLVLAAGCTTRDAPDPGADAGADAPIDLSLPLTWSYNGTACSEGDILLFVDKGTLQSKLPDGFVAADAQKLFAAQAPTIPGNPRGAILANAFACEGNDAGGAPMLEAQVAILVEAPEVEGVEGAASFDFYEVGRITPHPTLFRMLDGVGWTVLPGNVSAIAAASGTTATIEQDGAEAFSFETTTPGSVEFSGLGRFWHVVPTGLAYVDYDIPSVTQTAGSITCTIAAGSMLAEAAGGTACGPENAAGAGFIAFDPTVTLHYLPGVVAG